MTWIVKSTSCKFSFYNSIHKVLHDCLRWTQFQTLSKPWGLKDQTIASRILSMLQLSGSLA